MSKDQEIQDRIPSERLVRIEELVSPLTSADIKQLSTLGDITPDEAEELSPIFGREIPKHSVEKQTTKSRLKEILLALKK